MDSNKVRMRFGANLNNNLDLLPVKRQTNMLKRCLFTGSSTATSLPPKSNVHFKNILTEVERKK